MLSFYQVKKENGSEAALCFSEAFLQTVRKEEGGGSLESVSSCAMCSVPSHHFSVEILAFPSEYLCPCHKKRLPLLSFPQ